MLLTPTRPSMATPPERVARFVFLATVLPHDDEALANLLEQDHDDRMTPSSFVPDAAVGVTFVAREDPVTCAADRVLPEDPR